MPEHTHDGSQEEPQSFTATAPVVVVPESPGAESAAQTPPDTADESTEKQGEDKDEEETKAAPTGVAERLGQLFGVVVAIGVIGIPIINQQVQSKALRTWIFTGITAGVLIFLAGRLLYDYRKNPAVARTTAFIAMFLVVGLSTLLPVVVLSAEDRVLLLKLGAILVLSLIPALLYLQFIMVRGQTAKLEYIQNLHRLRIDSKEHLPEPNDDTSTSNLYLEKFYGLYGRIQSGDKQQVRIKGETLLPVLLTTLLLAVGWAFVFAPEIIFGRRLFPGSLVLIGKPIVPTEPLRYGLAGAYFYILQMLIRRYFQDDLKTSAYINAMARIIIVILLVTAVGVVWPSRWSIQQQDAFAFLIGIFPQIGLKALQNLLTVPLRGLIPSLQKDYPLSDLDGLNIWYESRLLEEGIEDMQNLATANLVDVILRTRVPVGRLVDWVDQAHLYLRVQGDGPEDRGVFRSRKRPKGGGARQLNDREKLRRLGIRTATDLQDAFTRPSPGTVSQDEARRQHELVDKLRWVLNVGGKADGLPSAMESILRTFDREPNLYHVKKWKEFTEHLEAAEKSESASEAAPAG
jgi:hypothetical protein